MRERGQEIAGGWYPVHVFVLLTSSHRHWLVLGRLLPTRTENQTLWNGIPVAVVESSWDAGRVVRANSGNWLPGRPSPPGPLSQFWARGNEEREKLAARVREQHAPGWAFLSPDGR